ncbi:YqzL family protein [Sporosalibacterium faouarense]|nr:YqzL family protein [Bacillota bacterium]
MVDANFYWKIFSLTGSIAAYLMYRKLLLN